LLLRNLIGLECDIIVKWSDSIGLKNSIYILFFNKRF